MGSQEDVNLSLNVKYPHTLDCLELEKQIKQLENEIQFYYESFKGGYAGQMEVFLNKKQAYFAAGKCGLKLKNEIIDRTTNILEYYSEESKASVVPESIRTRNILIVIAATTLLSASIIFVGNMEKK